MLIKDDLGGYIMRDGFTSGVSDVSVGLWSQTTTFSPAWNQPDFLHLNILGHDTQWGIGPGNSTTPSAERFSYVLVDGNYPDRSSTGRLLGHKSGANGHYVRASADQPFQGIGLNAIERQLMADFSGNTDVLGVVDIIDGKSVQTLGWNLYVPGLTLTEGVDSGFPWIMATNPDNGAWLKAWAVTPGATTELGSTHLRFNYDAEDIEIYILMEIGHGGQTPSTPTVNGSGLAATLTIDGRDFTYNSGATERLASSALTDLTTRNQSGFSVSRDNGLAPLNVNFSASTFAGQTYAWDFGDGTTATGSSAAHTYTEDGVYQASLVVTDALGVITRQGKTIRVGNRRPNAVLSAPVTKTVPGVALNFDASASTDPDGDAISYLWDMGDGTTYTTASITHTWSQEGEFMVRLRVTDSMGNIHGVQREVNTNNEIRTEVFPPISLRDYLRSPLTLTHRLQAIQRVFPWSISGISATGPTLSPQQVR